STDTSNANESFKKLSINKPILSPYTLWNIQLVPINIQKHFHLLNDLQSLTNNEEVFVSLNGKGQYIVSDQFKFDPETCPTNHDLNNQFYISQIQLTGPSIGQWRSIENSRQSRISQESNQQNGSISSENQESNKRKRDHKRLLRDESGKIIRKLNVLNIFERPSSKMNFDKHTFRVFPDLKFK
ncbi:unnamed protein product, partial [Brachionus calyciflorus]